MRSHVSNHETIMAMPFPLEVAGLDVMFETTGHGVLLEVNDGPVVSLVEELGQAYADTVAGKQCLSFSSDVATFSLQKAFEQQRFYLPSPSKL